MIRRAGGLEVKVRALKVRVLVIRRAGGLEVIR